MINKKPQNKNKGFTLIEVLVAIFILITAVVVPLTIGSKAFAYSNFVRDQSTASYLAQEAVEYIRLQRDNASLNPSPNGGWSDFIGVINSCIDPDQGSLGGCQFDVQGDGDISECDSGKCPQMYLQSQEYGGRYGYNNSGIGKGFLRSVKTNVEGSGALQRVRVDVTVLWNTNGIEERQFTVTDYLTPWQI